MTELESFSMRADRVEAIPPAALLLHEAVAPAVPVVIGGPMPVVLRGLKSLVEDTRGVRVSGMALDLDDFLEGCARAGRGVALADALLCAAGPRALVDAVRRRAPGMHVVLMADCEAAHPVREALQAGASGLLSRHDDADEIRAALLAVSVGRRHLSPSAARHMAESISLAPLTAREMDVLRLLSRGWVNKRIARELGIEVGTVKTHVSAIMAKLGSGSRTEVVLRASRLGLVSL